MPRYKGTIVRTYFVTADVEVEASNMETAKDLILDQSGEVDCWSSLRGFNDDEIEDLAEVEEGECLEN